MLTVEYKINGIMIAHTYIVNKGPMTDADDHTIYKFEHYRVNEGVVARGSVVHDQRNGAEVLVSKILKLVERPRKEKHVGTTEENQD